MSDPHPRNELVEIETIDVEVSEEQLRYVGFTNSGAPQFIRTVKDYAWILYQRAIRFGELDKARNFPLEITHEHVRNAARVIANSFGKPARPWWVVPTQVFEYVVIGFVGAGASNLHSRLGVATFGFGLFIAGILMLARLTKGRSE